MFIPCVVYYYNTDLCIISIHLLGIIPFAIFEKKLWMYIYEYNSNKHSEIIDTSPLVYYFAGWALFFGTYIYGITLLPIIAIFIGACYIAILFSIIGFTLKLCHIFKQPLWCAIVILIPFANLLVIDNLFKAIDNEIKNKNV